MQRGTTDVSLSSAVFLSPLSARWLFVFRLTPVLFAGPLPLVFLEEADRLVAELQTPTVLSAEAHLAEVAVWGPGLHN